MFSTGGMASRVKDTIVCPASDDDFPVLLPNPNDCSQFFMCMDETPILTDCPAGLYFNPDLGVCDYPQNVDCQQPSCNCNPPSICRPTSKSDFFSISYLLALPL